MERTVTIGLEEYISLRDEIKALKEREEILTKDISSVLVIVENHRAKRYVCIKSVDELTRKIIDENNELIKENKDLMGELDCLKNVNRELTLKLENKKNKTNWFKGLFQ